MNILALVPARGGSKGIPRKNIQPLAGKPLLAYTIEHARQTPAITRVVVSTDDAEIAAIAQQYGAEVVWRPVEISGDDASSESALLHALDYLRDTEGYEPDLVVFLQATSPLRQPDDIQKAIETLQREQADALFSACAVHGFIWRREGKRLSSLSYDYRNRPRRQEMGGEDLLENGSIYVFKPAMLRQYGNRLGGKIAVYRMHPLDSFQVDEPDDLQLIEQLLPLRNRQPRPRLATIRLLVLDFDGVLTDNRALVDEEGRESVWVNRSDGWGIARLKEAGVEVIVLSSETNPVVAARCRKLGIEYRQAEEHKEAVLQQLVASRGLTMQQVAYVGNDVNDLGCMRLAGVSVAVADAHPDVLQAAHLILSRPGGRGAVRELCDWILAERQRGQGEG